MHSSFSALVLAILLAVAEAQKGGKGGKGGGGAGGGTGKFKASNSTDPNFSRHTIYAPGAAAGEKFPLITWGNSGCAADGVGFATFLTELASHGYVVAVSGVGNSFTAQSTNKDMSDSINWAFEGKGAAKYNIDTTRIATSGQSCGGIQALMVGAGDPRVKVITLFNSGSLNAQNTAMTKTVKVPIGYFLGGSSDIAYANGQKDYDALPKTVPALVASINTGHMGTYFQANGGTYGKAAVAWFNWQLKNDTSGMAMFKAGSPLTRDGWTIKSRNFNLS